MSITQAKHTLNEITGLFYNTAHTGRLLNSLLSTAPAVIYFKYTMAMIIHCCPSGCYTVNYNAF